MQRKRGQTSLTHFIKQMPPDQEGQNNGTGNLDHARVEGNLCNVSWGFAPTNRVGFTTSMPVD
jgi:hypothetical protein